MQKTFIVLALTPLFLAGCGEALPVDGEQYVKPEKGNTFEAPDIKDDFCGVKISFQYCKCAFHNQYCGSIGMDKSGANTHVYSEYNTYVASLKEGFNTACESLNGFAEEGTCYVCPEGSIVEGERCLVPSVEEEPVEVIEEQQEQVSVDCTEIEENWEKYSDIDFRIPEEERSFEAKNYAQAQDNLVNTHAERAELLYETEILRGQLADVKEYKAALVDNLRDNLVKATLRLAYTTHAQIKGAKGAGESFSKFLTSTESIEALGAGMKSVQAVIPSDSKLAIDTKTVGGKVKSIGWNATLEAIESMGDPIAIGKQIVNDSKGAVLPSADITPEEVEILRVQNLENNLLNDVITEMEAKITDNETWLSVADQRIEDLESEVAKWKNNERDRVLLMLEDECQ